MGAIEWMINILLAEKDKNLSMLMCSCLKQEGYNVTEVSDIKELKNRLYLSEYHLLILDVDMLDMSINEIVLYVQLKRNISLILLTAADNDCRKIEMCKEHMAESITKPFSMRFLLCRINVILTKLGKIHKNEIEIGKLRVIYKEHSVYIGNNKCELTLKEYDLFCCLIENQGKVLSRDELLKMVWGINYTGNSRTVDTHIKRLRQKISYAQKHIKTVRKCGYVLEI